MEKFGISVAIGARAIIGWNTVPRYQIDFDAMDESTSVGDARQSIAIEHSTALFQWITELLVAIETRLQRLDGFEDETRDHAILRSLIARLSCSVEAITVCLLVLHFKVGVQDQCYLYLTRPRKHGGVQIHLHVLGLSPTAVNCS